MENPLSPGSRGSSVTVGMEEEKRLERRVCPLEGSVRENGSGDGEGVRPARRPPAGTNLTSAGGRRKRSQALLGRYKANGA